MVVPPIDFVYKVHHIPLSSPSIGFLAGRYAALRLSALTLSPNSFASTFTIESAFTAKDWLARLERPRVHFFVVVAYEASVPDEAQTIERGEWVAKLTILGPLKTEDYMLGKEAGEPPLKDDHDETLWQMTALYSSPSHRGKGIAKNLINGAVDFARQWDRSKDTRVRIFFAPTNLLARKLYEQLNFVDMGAKVTLAEAYVRNGDAMLMPADGGHSNQERYHTRRGPVMERIETALDA